MGRATTSILFPHAVSQDALVLSHCQLEAGQGRVVWPPVGNQGWCSLGAQRDTPSFPARPAISTRQQHAGFNLTAREGKVYKLKPLQEKLDKNQNQNKGSPYTQTELQSALRRNVDFPDGPVVKNLPANARDTELIPGLGRFHLPQGNETQAPQ